MEAERWRRPARWHSGPRLASSHNLYVVEQGEMALTGISGQWTARSGNVLFVPRGLRNELRACDRPCVVLVLRIRLSGLGLHVEADAQAWDLLSSLARHVHAHGPFLPLKPRTSQRLASLLRQTLREQEAHRAGSLCRIKARVLQMIADLADAVPPPAPARVVHAPASFQGIRQVIEHIERRYSEPIRVGDLARLAGLRRSQFHAAFRGYTGLTMVDYLTRVRIGEACRRLRDTPEGILQIAMQCGFGSVSRFYEAFGRVVHLSPGQWRQRLNAPGP